MTFDSFEAPVAPVALDEAELRAVAGGGGPKFPIGRPLPPPLPIGRPVSP